MDVRRPVPLALLCVVIATMVAARGESPAAFDRRCIPAGCVAPRSPTAGVLPRRVWRWPGAASITAVLGATRDSHDGRLAARGAQELIDSVLAVVEAQVILLSDVRLFLDLRLIEPPDAADPTRPVLTALIERQLMLEEVMRYVVEEPLPGELDARLATVVARVGGPTAFQALLSTVGFTVDDLRQVLRNDLRIERYLVRRFGSPQPTEDEVAAYFTDHADDFRIDGVLPSLDAARDDARRRLSTQLRQDAIDDWVASLTARADVFRVRP